MDDSASTTPLTILRDVSSALGNSGALSDRLAEVSRCLVPALADALAVHRLDERGSPPPEPDGHRLEVPLEHRGVLIGALHLVRRRDRPGFAAGERLLADEVASRISAAIALDLLEESSRSNDEFLATLSHEIRTPLNVVVGWVELLRGGRLPPERQARALELIERNARVQTRLMDDLLDAARMVSGQLRIEARPIGLTDVVLGSVESHRRQADEAGIALEVRGAAPAVNADAERMSQILQNLLGNALKFTPSGGRVDVEIDSDGDAALISVIDTGSGITPDILPHIFDRFWQGERRRLARTRGLGLGLFISRHLARLHGGDITAESAGPGKGSRFTVRLPLAGPR